MVRPVAQRPPDGLAEVAAAAAAGGGQDQGLDGDLEGEGKDVRLRRLHLL